MQKLPRALHKYAIGLAVLGILTIGLVGLVVVQASYAKADAKTYEAASNAANKLSSYVSSNNKIPADLSEAGLASTPDSITYKKLDEKRYRFCATYKADSSGLDATSLQYALFSTAMSGSSSADESDDQEVSYLYITSAHHRGENCQTVKPYIYTSSYYNFKSDSSSTNSCGSYAFDMTDSEYDSYRQCLQKQY